MKTPEENFETAIEDSSGREAREDAIDNLQTANECDKLADLARMNELDEKYRQQALTNLAHPPCSAMLETLTEEESLSEGLQQMAETLLEDAPDSSGAGP